MHDVLMSGADSTASAREVSAVRRRAEWLEASSLATHQEIGAVA